jgi:quercetin dioxygenase-like cupin family protein
MEENSWRRLRACPVRLRRRLSMSSVDTVLISVGSCPRRSVEFPVALRRSLNRTPEQQPQSKGNPMDHTIKEARVPARRRAAKPTIGGSVYVKPQEIAWEPTQFEGISIKVLYEDKAKGEMTCLLKWEPGATLPMHKHREIEQTFVIEGSFYDHDGICRAGEFVWRRVGSFHETHSDEGAVILAVYRKPNVFQHSTGYARDPAS